LEEYLGYDFRPHLAALWDNAYPHAERHRRYFGQTVDARMQKVYYEPYSQWCEDHGIALTGHPAQPGDIGVEKYLHIPGQDIVWRYIEPFQDKSLEGPQSTMAKCSVSAQRHYGRARNLNECFGAYGWEFTEEEMWWVTNWLLVRGVNLLSPHAFYYSVRDERRDERPPDVGPNNVWWDRYKPFADYCRRLSWLMATGRQVCHFAILGSATSLPWRAARALFESQRDFNYLDIDTLLGACEVDATGISVKDMTYRALIVDTPEYLTPDALRVLKPMLETGRVIAYADAIPEISSHAPDAPALVKALDAIVPPDVVLTPANRHVRFAHTQTDEGDAYLFANEGQESVDLKVEVAAKGKREWWEPIGPELLVDRAPDRLVIDPYRTCVLFCGAK
jgi:hypothetical protein